MIYKNNEYVTYTEYIMSVLLIKKVNPKAKLPCRQSEEAAGYDICALESVVIPPMGRQLVSTGIAMTVPKGTYGQLAPRSGLAVKKGLHVGAGVIDRDYTGEVKVLLFNLSDIEVELTEHERVAQLILKKIETPSIQEVESLLDPTRGSSGFGSTG